MQTYHFRTRVQADGSVAILNLPPHVQVEILVVNLEASDFQAEMETWLADLRARHPFTKMSKDDILAALRKTREEAWNERHEG